MRSTTLILVLSVIVYCDGKIEKDTMKGRRILKGTNLLNLPETLEKSPHKAILMMEPMNQTNFRSNAIVNNAPKGTIDSTIKPDGNNNSNIDVFKIVITGYLKRGRTV